MLAASAAILCEGYACARAGLPSLAAVTRVPVPLDACEWFGLRAAYGFGEVIGTLVLAVVALPSGLDDLIFGLCFIGSGLRSMSVSYPRELGSVDDVGEVA